MTGDVGKSSESTGAIRVGSVIEFAAQVVLALRVRACAAWIPLPRPFGVMVTTYGVDVAFTSLKHTFDFADVITVAQTKDRTRDFVMINNVM